MFKPSMLGLALRRHLSAVPRGAATVTFRRRPSSPSSPSSDVAPASPSLLSSSSSSASLSSSPSSLSPQQGRRATSSVSVARALDEGGMTERQAAIIAAFVASARSRRLEDEARRKAAASAVDVAQQMAKASTDKPPLNKRSTKKSAINGLFDTMSSAANNRLTVANRRIFARKSMLSRETVLLKSDIFNNFTSENVVIKGEVSEELGAFPAFPRSEKRKPEDLPSPKAVHYSEHFDEESYRYRQQQARHQSIEAMPLAERRRIQCTLYRRCLKAVRQWGGPQLAYLLCMEGVDALVRPSLRAALPQMFVTMQPSTILRFIFEFHLQTDTEKMNLWCTQAAFAFLKRVERGSIDRKLVCGWAAITSPSFTAIDAAVLVAYIHRYFNPIHDPLRLVPPGKDERLFRTAEEEREAMARGMERYHAYEGEMKDRLPSASVEGFIRHNERVAARRRARQEEQMKKRASSEEESLSRSASSLQSLDAFSEPILIKLDSLIERCRSAIPAKERARPKQHAKLIVQSVLDVMRWESSLMAFHGKCKGKSDASLNAIDEALLRRVCSHRLLALIVAHVLNALGVRAVALCHDDLPLVAVYSRHHKNKLQCCVDVVNTAILGPAETKEALSSLGINMSSSALGVRLLQASESVVSQAASLLAAMKRDAGLSDSERALYDKAAKFIAFVVEEEMIRKAVLPPTD